MGQPSAQNDTSADTAGSRRQRFARYFPRLFAYVQAMTGSEAIARDTAASAFEATLGEDHRDENEFTLSLFATGRELCIARARARDSLTDVEHEVLSLTFDAQLTREQVAELLGVNGAVVVATLLSGLRKLRDASPAAKPAQAPAPHGLTA
jgi:DNA-directed RNA polymerase specialized sigma24 family protein